MTSWDDDEYWDDEEPPAPSVPIEQEVERSVYMIPDRAWGFRAEGREHHPGVCVRCEVATRLAFLNKGTDLASARLGRFRHITVEPSSSNGLSKATAFALDPRRVRLHNLLNFHKGSEWIGRLEEQHFCVMRQHFDSLPRHGPGGRP